MQPVKKSYKIGLVILLAGFFFVGSGADAQGVSSTAPTAGFAFTQNLTIGTQGGDVIALQQSLIAGGYLKISTSTGYFGSLTMKALALWQAAVGISPSAGYFGPVSRGKINAAVEPPPITMIGTSSTTETIAATPQATGTLGESIGLPVRLTIPKLNIDAKFQYTGLKPDGTLEVPSNIYDVSWFTGSVRPGEKGVAIVMGHIAQIRGGIVTRPGVFSDLSELAAGDQLTVADDNGNSATFVVRAVRSYDPTADATDVFTSTDGGSHLNLITCEGTWIPSQASYTERLVVFTDLMNL
jgi:sortase (surface protein transpeptidase)